MCHPTCIAFGQRALTDADIRGKRVLEVGSTNINGSLRPWVETHAPQGYIGVDISAGPGVNEICAAENLVARFGKAAFDLVICTEVLEHVRDWRKVVSNLKNVLKPRGLLLVTTRSAGFGYHAFPHDFWRYEMEDGRMLFSDLTIEAIEEDTYHPGILVLARKPVSFTERDLCSHELFSIVSGRRCAELRTLEMAAFAVKWRLRKFLSRMLPAPVKALIKQWLGMSPPPEMRTRAPAGAPLREAGGLPGQSAREGRPDHPEADGCRRTSLMCACCGSIDFKERPVLWRKLIDQWRIATCEVAYINRQQGLRCTRCGANLRSMTLAKAVMACYGFEGIFQDFVRSGMAGALRVLEINEAGNLGPLLAQLPHHVRADYPQTDMTKLAWAEAAFDLVVHSDTLEHVAHPVRALSECRRVLARGGFCAFTVPIIVDRLTSSREGVTASFHGTSSNPADHIVFTEYGADAWKQVMLAGFGECRIYSLEYPASLALVGVR